MTISKDSSHPDVTIAVMGATGSGKTSFVNLISGSNLRVGFGLESCTNVVQVSNTFQQNGRHVTIIDTPGFDDTSKSDTEVLRLIAAFLATVYENGKRLAGVIFIHRISDFRVGGIAARNFKMFRQLCGETTLRNVVIVTNMWGEVTQQVGEEREKELITKDKFFKPVLDKGAQVIRHSNTLESARYVVDRILNNHPMPLRIQRELVDEHKDISETAAGEEVNKELMEQIRQHKAEIRTIQEEMKQAIEEKDEITRRELEAETKRLQGEMNKIQVDSTKMVTDYQAEKNRLEQRIGEMAEQARQENERVAAEYNRRMQDLQNQYNSATAASQTERGEMMDRINALQHQWDNRPRGGGGGGCLIM